MLKKTFHIKFKSIVASSTKQFREYIRGYFDYLFFPTAVILLFVFWCIFSYFFSIQDVIQLLIVITTLLVIFHSVYIKDYASQYRRRPVLDVELNFHEPDCHKTIANSGLQGTLIQAIPTFFIRFRVKNIGKTTANNTEVVVEKVKHKGNVVKSFVPLNLIWSLTEHSFNRGATNIPQGMFRTVDLIKIMNPSNTENLAYGLSQIRNNPHAEILARKFSELTHGIGICALNEPNTLSDVLNANEYEFYISASSDNTQPLFAKFFVSYNEKWEDDTESMFSKNLKVQLVKSGYTKEEVFD